MFPVTTTMGSTVDDADLCIVKKSTLGDVTNGAKSDTETGLCLGFALSGESMMLDAEFTALEFSACAAIRNMPGVSLFVME